MKLMFIIFDKILIKGHWRTTLDSGFFSIDDDFWSMEISLGTLYKLSKRHLWTRIFLV